MLKVFLIILAVIALIFLFLYFMTIRIKFKTIRKNEDDVVIVRVKTLYGIVNIKFEVPLLDIVFVKNKPALKYKAEMESNRTNKLWKKVSKIFSIDDFNNIKKYFRHDPVLLKQLKDFWIKKLSIHEFSFILKYGILDAALTAWIYGVVWIILGSLLALMKNNLNFNTKDIVVTPYFDRETFNLEFSCIIKFKFGDIINTGIMILKRGKQRKKIKQNLNDNLNIS